MKTEPLRFGLQNWIADGGHERAGRIAYIGTRASVTTGGQPGLELLLASGADVAAAWTPEHGYGATEEHGETVGDMTSGNLPYYSLYGARTEPDNAMLKAVDTIVYDLQDVGARYYTYWYVLKQTLRVAHRAAKHYVVCDRPNPLGAAVWGNVLPPSADADVGCWPMAMCHGLVASDVVEYWANAYEDVAWERAPITGWTRDLLWSDLDLSWTAPSPNLPSLDAVCAYPGTCLWEGITVSVGRGTPWPFQWVGAPWLDAARLAAAMNEANCGWGASVKDCTPEKDPYAHCSCHGVMFEPTEPTADPVRLGLCVIAHLLENHAKDCEFHERHFDALAGGGELRTGLQEGISPLELMDAWETERATAPLQPIEGRYV